MPPSGSRKTQIRRATRIIEQIAQPPHERRVCLMSYKATGQRTSSAPRRAAAGAAAAAIALAGLIVPAMPAMAADPSLPQVAAHYDMSASNGQLVDVSGHNHNGTIKGLAASDFKTSDGEHFLTTTDGDNSKYVELPAGILNTDNDFAVEMTVKADTAQNTAAWTIGRGDGPWNTTKLGNYVFMAPYSAQDNYKNQILSAIRVKTDDQNDESRLPSGGALSSDKSFSTVTLSSKDNKLTLYVNGEQRAELTHSFQLKDIIKTSGVLGYIGHSLYDGDQGFIGSIADVKLYDTSLTQDQVKASEPSAAERAKMTSALAQSDKIPQEQVLKATLKSNASADAVTSDLLFPTLIQGHTFTYNVPVNTVVASDGSVTRPVDGEKKVTVAATDTTTGQTYSLQYTFPVLSGAQLADSLTKDVDDAIASLNKTTTENLPLVTSGANKSSITWTSSDPSVITGTDAKYANKHAGVAMDDPYKGGGKVTRPAYGKGDSKPVTLTATASLGGKTVTKSTVVTVKEKVRTAPDTGYASVTFRDDHTSGQRLWESATSTTKNDFFSFTQINNSQPVITSDSDTGGLRDPFVLRSHDGDKYYMLATDLDVDKQGWGQNQQYGSLKMEVWESTDLVNWTRTNAPADTGIKVNADNQGMTWAPEAFWDDDLDSYVVFFSSREYTDSTRSTSVKSSKTHNDYNVVRICLTRDFKTFTPTQDWQNTQYSRIDSDVFKIGDYYYRLTKNEERGAAGSYITHGKSTFLERSKVLTSTTTDASPTNDPNTTWQLVDEHILPFEGPESIKLNKGDVNQNAQGDAMVIMADSGGYQPYMTSEHQLAADNWDNKLSLSNGWHTQKKAGPGVTGYVYDTGMPTPKRHGAFVSVPANVLSNMHRWTTAKPTTPDPVKTAVSLAKKSGRTYTATVTADDKGEVAGKVRFSATKPGADSAFWSQEVSLGADGTASVTLPDWADPAQLTVSYLGYGDVDSSTLASSAAGKGVDVPAVPSAGLSLENKSGSKISELDMEKQSDQLVKVTVSPSSPVIWSSSDPSVATVEAASAPASPAAARLFVSLARVDSATYWAKITALKKGTTTITATTEDGRHIAMQVNVSDPSTPGQPDQPGKPGEGGQSGDKGTTTPGKPGQSGSKSGSHAASGRSEKGGLVNTGSAVIGFAALAAVLVGIGSAVVLLRRRRG